MNLEISHVTRYEYDREVRLQPHLMYVRPRENPLLRVERFSLAVSPDARIDWMRDDFDNLPACARFARDAARLEISSLCTVTTSDVPPFDFLVRDYAVHFPFAYEPLHRANLGHYLVAPEAGSQAALQRWLEAGFPVQPRETVRWLFALNEAVFRNVAYRRRDEPGIQSPSATLALGSGSCRDFAVLLIACARLLGVAARFVSGYLFDPAADGAISGTMHAWVEVFIPGAGWKGMDPTHGIFCQNAYVPVAHAVVAESVNPIQGSFFSQTPATAHMTTDVRVRRLP